MQRQNQLRQQEDYQRQQQIRQQQQVPQQQPQQQQGGFNPQMQQNMRGQPRYGQGQQGIPGITPNVYLSLTIFALTYFFFFF